MFSSATMTHFLDSETDPCHHPPCRSCKKWRVNSIGVALIERFINSNYSSSNLSKPLNHPRWCYCFANSLFLFSGLATTLGPHAKLTTVISSESLGATARGKKRHQMPLSPTQSSSQYKTSSVMFHHRRE